MSPADARGNLPLFLSLSPRERDEFLRGIGVREYDDINLFNLLCSYAAKRATARVNVPDLLSAVATWARSHNKPNLMGGSAKASLRRVLGALERNGYAMTKDDANTILLRDGARRAGQGDKAVSDIEKAFSQIEADAVAPYPSSASVSVPATAVVPVSHTEFTAEFVETHAASTKIIKITFADDVDMLVIPALLPRLLDIARRRVHFYIQNNPSLYNYVLFELRKIPQFRHLMDRQRIFAHLENRIDTPPLFWVYLGLAVARSREEDLLEPKLRPGRLALYQSAYLLHGYWQHQHQLEQEKKRRQEDELAVIAWVERGGRGFTLEELQDIRDERGKPIRQKYEDVSGFIQDLLERQRLEADAAGQVPPLVEIGDLWTHRGAVVPLLEEELKSAAEHCRRTIEADWKTKLDKGGLTDPAMGEDEAFAAELSAVVASRCTRLASMLKKPRLVHLILTEVAESDPSAYRKHGTLFESLENPTFKRMDRLLGLERDPIISKIVSGMTLLRRILLRRRFRVKRPEPGAQPPGATGARPAKSASSAGMSQGAVSDSAPDQAEEHRGPGSKTVKITRPKKTKPATITVERPSRRKKGPRNMDEAMDQLKVAMSKRRRK